jgi:hypothetical protein
VPIGGKTGTGDNRVERYASNGSVLESRVRNRTAAFVFMLGDRFFGTLLVYTQEPNAASKQYTSALAVRVFRNLAPAIRPLLVEPAASGTAPAAVPTPTESAPLPVEGPVDVARR